MSGGGIDLEGLRKEVEQVDNPFRHPRRVFLFGAYFRSEVAAMPRYWKDEEVKDDWKPIQNEQSG